MSPLLPRAPRAILRMDAITVQQPATGTDAEGDPLGAAQPRLEDRGTLMRVSATEQLLAAQRGTNVDKALGVELGKAIFEGNVVQVYGATYEVVAAEDRRLYRRLLLRKR